MSSRVFGSFRLMGIAALGLGLALHAALLGGCGSSGSAELPSSVTKRQGSVLVDGCSLDAGQKSTLRATPTRQVISEVTLLCLSMQDSGAVGFRDSFSQAELMTELAELHDEGYKLSLGVTAVDAMDAPLTPAHLATLFSQPSWRQQTVKGLVALSSLVDGLEFAPPQLDSGSRVDVTLFVRALSQVVRPGRQLGIFAPPSVAEPSDVIGGEAFDVRSLSPLVDRTALMTLDFSCCNVPPGPTIDANWAIDAAHLAATKAPASQLDVAMPLYGTDFTVSSNGSTIAQASVTYDQAQALAAQYQTTPQRGSGDSLSLSYRDAKGNDHRVFYDDSRSTLRTLATWTPAALPATTRVIYYGLGAEDPTLWADLAQAQR